MARTAALADAWPLARMGRSVSFHPSTRAPCSHRGWAARPASHDHWYAPSDDCEGRRVKTTGHWERDARSNHRALGLGTGARLMPKAKAPPDHRQKSLLRSGETDGVRYLGWSFIGPVSPDSDAFAIQCCREPFAA